MTKQDKRPNFIIFCTDQQRADHLGCMGNPIVKTPNLDRIAADGVTFSNCYTSSPACMPARATMFTGLTNRGNDVRTNGINLSEDIPTLPGLLAKAGYRTHSAGKLHLKAWGSPTGYEISDFETGKQNPERIAHWRSGKITQSPDNYYGFQTQDMTIGHVDYIDGDYRVWLDKNHPGIFDMYRGTHPSDLNLPEELHYNNWIADRSIEFMKNHAPSDQPFFLWCSFPDPHFPFAGVKRWTDVYRDKEIPLPQSALELPPESISETMTQVNLGKKIFDAEYIRQCTIQTYGMISHVDEQIGRVLDSLQANGLADNTFIMFISDHGEQLGEHGLFYKGFYPYDAHARIPFLCKVPGIAGNRKVEDVVSMLDLVPTVLDLASVPQPEEPEMNSEFSIQCAPLPSSLPGESLKKVLIEGGCPERKNALVEFDDERVRGGIDLLQMRMLVTNDYKLVYYSPTNEVMLFDRKNDPSETRNLAAVGKYAGTVQELLKTLLKEISRTEKRHPRRFAGA